MTQRIGKYIVSKKEAALSLADGGTVGGALTVTGAATFSGAITATAVGTGATDPAVSGRLFCSSSARFDTGSAKVVLVSQG